MPHLTKRHIDATPCPATGELWLPDDSLPGFGVRLRAGRKTYCLRYRTPSNHPRRETLGLTTVLTLVQARTLAQAFLVAVRQGRDPGAERQAIRHAPSMADLAARYLAEHAELKKKPGSVRMDRTNLRIHILPILGKSLVAAITRGNIAALHHRLHETPGAANRCLALLSTMLGLAEQWGLRQPGTNPVRGIQRYREQKMERFLSNDELARLGAVLAQAEAGRSEHPSVLACIRLLIFTGARLGEILGLRWEYIDVERGVARLPDSKTGAKLLRLPGPALEVLQNLRRESGNPWVLPGRRQGKPLNNPHRPWYRICAAAGLDGIRLHDLRHSYASMGARLGLSLPMLGALLGHQHVATTARYAHLVGNPVTEAGELVAQALGEALREKAATK